MPDPYQYDPSLAGQSMAVPQPYYPQVQAPAQQMQDYSYLANQNFIMNQQYQNNNNTLAIAQQNMQMQMQSVLQGTMAAGMAIYSTGKMAHEKMREAQYQDMLLGNGKYVLESSNWRVLAKATGLMDSSIGQALKIGGRRPEYLSEAEYGFQLDRMVHHRKEEFFDQLLSGGATAAGMALGTAVGGPLGMVGGLVAGTAIDMTIGKVMEPFLASRKAGREMRQYMEVTDLNRGVGQRRMTEETADELGRWAHDQDTSAWKYVPLVGGIVNGRLSRDTKFEKLIKDMSKEELFRDVDIKDIDKIKKRVEETAEVIEKFAGLMHVTKETVLKMKGNLSRMGYTAGQQDTTLNNIANFTMGTGLTAETGMSYNQAFMMAGYGAGYYNQNQPGRQGAYGLMEVASIKAGQEANLVSRLEDAGTLAMSNYAQAINTMNTPWGKVIQRGGGSLGKTEDYYRKLGNGSVALGMQLDRFNKDTNPLENMQDYVTQTYKEVKNMTGDARSARAFLLSMASNRQEAENIESMLDGSKLYMDKAAILSEKKGFRATHQLEDDKSYKPTEALKALGILKSEFGGINLFKGDIRSAGRDTLDIFRRKGTVTQEGSSNDVWTKYSALGSAETVWSNFAWRKVSPSKQDRLSASDEYKNAADKIDLLYQDMAYKNLSQKQIDERMGEVKEFLVSNKIAEDDKEAEKFLGSRILDKEKKEHKIGDTQKSFYDNFRSDKASAFKFLLGNEGKKYSGLAQTFGQKLSGKSTDEIMKIASVWGGGSREDRDKIAKEYGLADLSQMRYNDPYNVGTDPDKAVGYAIRATLQGRGITEQTAKVVDNFTRSIQDKYGSKAQDKLSDILYLRDQIGSKNFNWDAKAKSGFGAIMLDEEMAKRALAQLDTMNAEQRQSQIAKFMNLSVENITDKEKKAKMEAMINNPSDDPNRAAIDNLAQACSELAKAITG